MSIDVADTASVQPVLFNKLSYLVVCRDICPRQIEKNCEFGLATPQISQRYFANDKGMGEYLAFIEQQRHFIISGAEVIDPHRSVDKDHCFGSRRRGIGFKSG